MIWEDGLLKDSILSLSTAIRTPCLPEVRNTLSSLEFDYDSVEHYKTNIKEWLSPVIDLSMFFVYPVNGITEGLNWWMANESRSIHIEKGDYQWVQPKSGNGDILYMSCPSSIDGNFVNIPTHMPVALDLAYVGSTEVRQIPMTDNIEYVFYSLSKPFGVRNIRTGWIFTRKEDKRLHDLTYNAKYYNYNAHHVAEKIINSYGINYIHNMFKNQQKMVCQELDAVPSDSVWLATSTHDDYQKFRRKNNIARLCLSGIYKL